MKLIFAFLLLINVICQIDNINELRMPNRHTKCKVGNGLNIVLGFFEIPQLQARCGVRGMWIGSIT
jgi:hypothetical protein